METESSIKKELSELITIEPSSLDIMVMLNDEGPMTFDEISNKIICSSIISDLLNKMKKFKVIGFINNLIYITSYGQQIIKKMRKNIKEEQREGVIVGL